MAPVLPDFLCGLALLALDFSCLQRKGWRGPRNDLTLILVSQVGLQTDCDFPKFTQLFSNRSGINEQEKIGKCFCERRRGVSVFCVLLLDYDFVHSVIIG